MKTFSIALVYLSAIVAFFSGGIIVDGIIKHDVLYVGAIASLLSSFVVAAFAAGMLDELNNRDDSENNNE